MTFGLTHYVPVLKVKRAEKAALQLIAPAIRSQMTPLLEIVERRKDKKPTVAGHLDTAFKGLAESVRPYARCFLDAREIALDGPPAAEEVFQRATAAGIAFIPVTGVSRTVDVAAALNYAERGVAIRLSREEFEQGGLERSFRAFVRRNGLRPRDTDLIVDLGPVEEMIPEGIAAFARQFLLEVPEPNEWRNLTLSGSSFPRSMGVVQRKSHAFVDRAEWLTWKNHFFARRNQIPRLPTYSDCAIQHPEGVEGFDPVTMQASAAIRYALPESWLLIKGESTKRILPSKQFPQLSTHLVYGHLRAHFAGEDHCEGCSSIKSAADGKPKLGGPEAWRRIGTVHHLTQVTQDLTSLPGV